MGGANIQPVAHSWWGEVGRLSSMAFSLAHLPSSGYMKYVHLRLSKTRNRKYTEVRPARFLPSDA